MYDYLVTNWIHYNFASEPAEKQQWELNNLCSTFPWQIAKSQIYFAYQYVLGAALIAFQLFTNLAETAERLNELELRSSLQANAELVFLSRKLNFIFWWDSPN